jgi:alpha-glucosidase
MTGEPIRIPRPGEALLTSGPVDLDGAQAVIPADTTVWWSVR